MKTPCYLLVYCFFATTLISKGQNVNIKPVKDVPKYMFMKVAWADDNGFCIVSERLPSSLKFPHVLSFYNRDGELIQRTDKIKSGYSSQHEYFLCIQKSIAVFDHSKDDFGIHSLFVSSSIDSAGNVVDSMKSVFRIKRSEERDKLNKESYSFNVYKGEHNLKGLITYNNDYKDSYQEGFRFRIINPSFALTPEDTFFLPYNDRVCNIKDVVFDDVKNKIIVLCDLFELKDTKRIFLKSFIAVYDISEKTYSETDEMPSFNNCHVQHCIDDNRIVFSGIDVKDKDYQNCTYSFVSINILTLETEQSYTSISNEAAKEFFMGNKSLDTQYLQSCGIYKDQSGNYHSLWNYYLTFDDIVKIKNNNSNAIAGFGLAFGLLGAGLMAVATSNNSVNVNASSLWITDNRAGNVKTSGFTSNTGGNNYSLKSFNALSTGGNAYGLNNSSGEKALNYRIFKNDLIEDSILSLKLNEKVHVILPQSKYKTKGKEYFIGRSGIGKSYADVDDKPKYYLLEFE